MPPTKPQPEDNVMVKLESGVYTGVQAEIKVEDPNVQAKVQEGGTDTQVKTDEDATVGSETTNVAPARIQTALRPVERQPGDEERRNEIIERWKGFGKLMSTNKKLAEHMEKRTGTRAEVLKQHEDYKRQSEDPDYEAYRNVKMRAGRGRFWCNEDRKWRGERLLIPWNDKEVGFMLEDKREREEQIASHVNNRPKKRKRESQMETIYSNILTVAKSDKQTDHQSKEITAMLVELKLLRSGAADDE